MARYQFQGIFHDGNGKVVSDGTISVYLAGTTTVASVYEASSGGTAVNSVTSDSSGVFSFWVDDSDYGITQLFKLVLSMTNFETKTYDYIFVTSQTSSLIDLTSVQTFTNKTLTTPVIASVYQDAGKTNLVTIPATTDTLVGKNTTDTFTNKTLTTPIVASMYQDAAKTKLMTTPDTASDTLAAIAATQTLTNKTLTTPIVASLYQDAGKTKLMTVPNTASDTLTANAATQTLTNKTLTSPILTTPLINDGDTGLSITSANQTHAAPTATIPNIGDAADTFVMADTTQTLTGKTLTSPTITSPVINVTSDVQGDVYYRNSSGNLARLAPGTSGYYLKTQGASADPIWGSVKWVDLVATTDFATTAASTSTITMNTDQTANILVGYAIKFTLSSVVYYAQCSAIASNLLTVRGAPLTTGAGALTAVSYSPLPSQVEVIDLSVDGYYEDATDSTLYLSDMRKRLVWENSKAYVVGWDASHVVADTGTEANVTIMVNTAAVGTANTNTGFTMSASANTVVSTVVDINTANYDINRGELLDVQVTKAGTGDARDMTLLLTVVYP